MLCIQRRQRRFACRSSLGATVAVCLCTMLLVASSSVCRRCFPLLRSSRAAEPAALIAPLKLLPARVLHRRLGLGAAAAQVSPASSVSDCLGLGLTGMPGPAAHALVDELLKDSQATLNIESFLLLVAGRVPASSSLSQEMNAGEDEPDNNNNSDNNNNNNSDLFVEVLLRTREAARQRREFVVADALKKQLKDQRGLDVKDNPDGSSQAFKLLFEQARAVEQAKAAAVEGAAARAMAQEALAKSLLADSMDEVISVTGRAASCVRQRLSYPGARAGRALQGRQPADVALALALAGCDDVELFSELASQVEAELERTAQRSLALPVAQIVERCAAAGFRQQDCPGLYSTASAVLRRAGFPESSPTMRDLEAGNFSLHSERPLLWLFRHALRQGRRCLPPADASDEVDAAVAALNSAEDASGGPRPLTLDLGCGFGISSLGLAVSDARGRKERCILAVDASAHCSSYARALARRWKLPPERLRIEHCSAEQALHAAARQYRGPVEWVLVNFPTPFAEGGNGTTDEAEDRRRNCHLPVSARSADFMANAAMLRAARDCILARGGSGAAGGALLVQSNVEDVAVTLRAMAEADGWEAIEDGSLGPEVAETEESALWLPRRQLRHALSGGPRAYGPGWLAASPLPQLAATETERYYGGEGLPIHRVALRPKRRH
ncbi:unnamed protein product [Polarella glacialis]|uniref:Uncharacterized protein n=1 Tax=Polarella glacialis TaxID=89957 RepID=A0A813JKI7_POLGL|nr:unnamed protein product [Polarella glacialis]